ncbi:MAG: LysM peptidoglycan-binding domain-containing protein [Bdellovibrionaceae bacterium]|nr:LysM peptidoglycan-binding domain-containing protein [Pseudobdellovibrionaceae bacterium]
MQRWTSKLSVLLLSVAFLASCAHTSNKAEKNAIPTDPTNGPATATTNVTGDGDAPAPTLDSFHLQEDKPSNDKVSEFDEIPSEVNPLVEKWIGYFQGKGRGHMERYLARSARYEKLMKKVLRDNKLPEDLFYIALIESGFSARATSHASAVGYWQFIRGTGKRYGLEINKFVDERRDPEVATQAAADYFKALYSMFGSWYLSMASYNVGEGKVKREINRLDTRDFWEIAKKKRLPRETVNYIPKYLAARLIAKDPDKYGFGEIDYLPPIEFDTVKLNEPLNLRIMSEKMGLNYEDFKALNPKFKGEIATLSNNSLTLRIPVGTLEAAKLAANESKVDKVEFVADAGDTQEYRIRRGDSLYTIARKFRTTVAYLRDLNDIPRKKRLKVGSRISVPDRTPRVSKVSYKTQAPSTATTSPADSKPVASNSQSQEKTEAMVQTNSPTVDGISKFYIVQSGDSLFSIAMKYNTTVENLKKLNSIRRGRVLKVGAKIRLPADVSDNKDETTTNKSQNSQDSTQKKINKGRRQIAVAKNMVVKAKTKKQPKKTYHIVRRGENLEKIANKYDINLSDIKSKNKIRNSSKILVGQRILIPTVN